MAAAYTTLVSYIILTMLHVFLVKRIKLGEIYNNKFMVGTIAIGCAITLGINWLYKFKSIRYGSVILYIIIFGIVVWKYKDKILKMFHKKEGNANV